MEPELFKSTFQYYNERAPEYEEIYTLGLGSTALNNPQAYQQEVKIFPTLIEKTLTGRVIDIGCGTGFWLPFYARHCEAIYLFDQSLNMLSLAQQKTHQLGIRDKCRFLSGDFWKYSFNNTYFDSALLGFFFSHITDYNEYHFFKVLEQFLKNGAPFLILDSVWNRERAKTRPKMGRQVRTLNDGRTFQIYKRYFSPGDFKLMGEKYGIHFEVLHCGKVYIAVRGSFSSPS